MARLLRLSMSVLVQLLTIPVGVAQVSANSSAAPAATPLPNLAPYTFRVTTREVVIDLVALNAHDRPVFDLSPADLRVSERKTSGKEKSETISSLRFVQAAPAFSATEQSQPGFHVGGDSCLDHTFAHYELAYHPGPAGWTSGYHEVRIATRRRGVRLLFRRSYFVGATHPSQESPSADPSRRLEQLRADACYHPPTPSSIGLRAHLIDPGSTNAVRYLVAVDADSLAFISLSDEGRHVELDYAVCDFDADGRPIDYYHASVDQILTPVEYARAEAHGFPHIIEFPTPKNLAMTRFIVLDRITGNVGATSVLYAGPPKPPEPSDRAFVKRSREMERAQGIVGYGPLGVPPKGPLGSFGSVVPRANSLCGDVYEIPSETPLLPDFRRLDPVGTIYTSRLDVPDQIFSGTPGISGVTSRTIAFGIDYYGEFWVTSKGRYDFRMLSDDGAILQIDDERVIDLDGVHVAEYGSGSIELDAGPHTIHIPYFQELPPAVALVLWVRAPGETWTIFDLRDFPSRRSP